MWYKNIRAQNLLIFFFSFTGLASSFYVLNLTPRLSVEERFAVEKIIFSDLFNDVLHQHKENKDYFFISVDGEDPSRELLHAFEWNQPVVEPISSAEMTFGFSAPVVHKSDRKKHGIIFSVESINKKRDGKIEVITTLYADRGHSATYKYILNKISGHYLITSKGDIVK